MRLNYTVASFNLSWEIFSAETFHGCIQSKREYDNKNNLIKNNIQWINTLEWLEITKNKTPQRSVYNKEDFENQIMKMK